MSINIGFDVEHAMGTFGALDFAFFVGFLVASTSIGIYFGYVDRKKASTSNYYFAEKNMNVVAVGLSLSVTYISAVTMIAIPAEVYVVGNVIIWAPVMILLAAIITVVYFIPAYGRLQLQTIYEYMELRFSKGTRRLCTLMTSICLIFYVGATIYLPSLAISAVTPISLISSILLTGVLCTFYTSLGGMKAVIWSDVLQTGVMIFGSVSVFICTTIDVGGFQKLFESIENGKRMTAFKSDFNASSRMSALAISVDTFVSYVYFLAFSQPVFQRFQSCRGTRQAQWSMFIYAFPTSLLNLLAVANGCVMYVYYEGCDPVKSGKVFKLDQGLPYMALQVFETFPGMAGLFVAAIFSGSFSTVSSGINSLSILFIDELVVIKWPSISEKRKLWIGKVTVIVFGLGCMCIAFLIIVSEATIIKLLYSVMALVQGPITGMFILGLFFPFSNSLGAILGSLSSVLLLLWMFIGSIFWNTVQTASARLPTSIEKCPGNITLQEIYNSTPHPSHMTTLGNEMLTFASVGTNYSFDQFMYNISFRYYTFIGMLFTIVSGLAVSIISGRSQACINNPKLFIPLLDNDKFPKVVREIFRCGIPVAVEEDEKHEENEMAVSML